MLQRRIALPLLQRFFGASYDDMRRMETILQETTDVDWVSLRAKGRAITYGDLATALLDSLARQDLYRHVAYVAN